MLSARDVSVLSPRRCVVTLAGCVALLVGACGGGGGGTTLDARVPDAAEDAVVSEDGEAPDGGTGEGCPEVERSFTVYDLTVMPPGYPTKTFVCAAAGRHGIVWVEESIFGSEMTQAEADDVLVAFDRSTPADSTRGIYALTTTAFGEPSDVDDNDRVFLLYYRLGSYGGSAFDGFIRREDVLGGAHSNHAEILYLDGVRVDPTSEYALGVVAHEFQHLIHLVYDPDEEGWLNETLSQAAMVISGYLGDLTAWVPSWLANPNQTLTTEPPHFHYGAGLLFGTYLLERYGVDFLTALVEEPTNGVASVETTLTAQGEDADFGAILGDWAMANFLDAPGLEGGIYGYTTFDVPLVTTWQGTLPTASPISRTLQPYGAYYYVFTVTAAAESTVEVHIDSSSWQDLTFRWAAYPAADKGQAVTGRFLMDAAAGTLVVPDLGGDVDRLVLVAVESGGVLTAAVDVTADFP